MTISVVFTIGFVSTAFFIFSILFSGFGALIRNIKRRRSVLEIQSPNKYVRSISKDPKKTSLESSREHPRAHASTPSLFKNNHQLMLRLG